MSAIPVFILFFGIIALMNHYWRKKWVRRLYSILAVLGIYPFIVWFNPVGWYMYLSMYYEISGFFIRGLFYIPCLFLPLCTLALILKGMRFIYDKMTP